MLLQALTSYYDRLAASGTADLPAYGFSREKISFCVVLEEDGALHGIEDLRELADRKLRPRLLQVPHRGSRSVDVTPNFLWDKTAYVLGAGKGDPARVREEFAKFVELHNMLAPTIGSDPNFSAVLRFLKSWQPADANKLVNWSEIRDQNLVFRVRGRTEYVHDRKAVRDAWRQFCETAAGSFVGQCLVTGAQGPIERKHGLITGFPGAQSSGAALVTFNADAFESYGKTQNFNAPVGTEAAFKYWTALKQLIRREDGHAISIAGDTVMFWTDKPNSIEQFFGPVIEGVRPENDELRDRLRVFLQRLRTGTPSDAITETTRFFVTGISPNRGRLSIRFWHDTFVADMLQRLREHVSDLNIDGNEDSLPLTLRDLIAQTARVPEDAPPLLAGALLRAVLTGGLYPEGLYSAVLRRIRIDGHVPRARAAILKACLCRKSRVLRKTTEVPVSLDSNHPDPAYHAGRLFAVLEKIQRDALGDGLSATIKDRFFGAASTTPSVVFPRLIKLSQHHLSRLENPAFRIAHERRIGEICERFDHFPRRLTLDQQGLFALGYYHQNRALYRPTPSAQAVEEAQA